ncbi:hypothetical protein OG21DRAFT_1511345 [Imleria badia]|nr:hypothetical protein OG21DRAFT_1511345 [Imleria badia]
MFTPSQFEPYHASVSAYETEKNEYHSPSGVITEDHHPGTQLEDIIQRTVEEQWTETNMHSWYPPANTVAAEPMSPYQTVLRLEMETLFGTANRPVFVAPAPLNDVTAVTEVHGSESVAGLDNANHTLAIAPMAKEHSLVNTSQTQVGHSCFVAVPCQCTSKCRSEACGAEITCESIPSHFANAHHIKNLQEDDQIPCCWEGCQKRIKRKFFVRHVRERHLGHHRKNNRTSGN